MREGKYLLKRTIAVIAGPTAVGKTEYAIAAARALSGQIISADSMQIYKWMDVGSAKPTPEEQAQAKHLLVDEIDPRIPFSAANYQALAKKYIRQTFDEGLLPIVSGGTGLYVNSLIYEMDFSTLPGDPEFRSRLMKEAEQQGAEALHNRLKQLDSEAAGRIHPNNVKKVIRAIEICENGGQRVRPFEEALIKTKDYDCVLIGLDRDRQELYERIDLRVDLLVAQGLFEEVERLLELGLTEENISMKGIGYKEIIGYFHQEYDREEAIRLVKRNTRHYAKRQLTWFRRYPDMKWLNLSDYPSPEEAKQRMIQMISEEL